MEKRATFNEKLIQEALAPSSGTKKNNVTKM